MNKTETKIMERIELMGGVTVFDGRREFNAVRSLNKKGLVHYTRGKRPNIGRVATDMILLEHFSPRRIY